MPGSTRRSTPRSEILEQYLNTVYFGANAYGAEAAASTYYNKKAADLTLPESALLAGIINLPGTYDPFNDPESAPRSAATSSSTGCSSTAT